MKEKVPSEPWLIVVLEGSFFFFVDFLNSFPVSGGFIIALHNSAVGLNISKSMESLTVIE